MTEVGSYVTEDTSYRRSFFGKRTTKRRPSRRAGKSAELLLQRCETFGHLRAKPPGNGLKLFEVGTMLTHGLADFSRKSFQALVFRGKLQYLIPRRSRLGRDFSNAFFRA